MQPQVGWKTATYIVVCSTLLLMVSCPERALGKSLVMLPDAPATKSAVLNYIPIGSSISQAATFMEQNGFKCGLVKNQKYADYSTMAGQQITRGPADFLWCDSGERFLRLLVSKRWQVVFEDIDGKVAYVAVGVGLTGP